MSLLLAVIVFIYSLPSNIINIALQGVNVFMQSSTQNGDGGGAMIYALSGVAICAGCIGFILSIIVAIALPAIYANFAIKGNFGAAFAFGEIFGLIKAAPGAYVLTLLGCILAGIIGVLGMIACVIGVIFTMAYALAIAAHLYGQAYNAANAAVVE